MQITADFDELCRLVCPICNQGGDFRYRSETQEYVHDVVTKNNFAHSICWANGLRKKYQNG
jgi:hypothetical protein